MALGDLVEKVHGLIWIGYPGEEGGSAVAEIIFGYHSPSGKLPVTFYRSISDLPPYEDYRMEGRTYRFFGGEPEFPFGFGLSYARFAFSDLSPQPSRLRPGRALRLRVRVSNLGECSGDEVVQVYLSHEPRPEGTPRHALVAFRRVTLRPGETRVIKLVVPPEAFLLLDEEGRAYQAAGRCRLEVGGCSPGRRGPVLGAPTPVVAEVELIA